MHLAGSVHADNLQRKHCLIKEHAFMVSPLPSASRQEQSQAISEPTQRSAPQKNPTVFSDEEMLSWQPLFLIRNPIAAYESWLRVEGSPYPDLTFAIGQIYTTLEHQRKTFDWYQQMSKLRCNGKAPMVIDADDLIDRPEVLHKLCSLTGMNRDELVFEWEAKRPMENPSERMKRVERFHSSIWGSTGIDQSKTAKDLDLTTKEAEWSAMFGVELAKVLVERVEQSWPDYEYLKAHKLC